MSNCEDFCASGTRLAIRTAENSRVPAPMSATLSVPCKCSAIQNFVWLLQGIALGIVKHLGPFFGVVKGVAHMLLLHGRYRFVPAAALIRMIAIPTVVRIEIIARIMGQLACLGHWFIVIARPFWLSFIRPTTDRFIQ